MDKINTFMLTLIIFITIVVLMLGMTWLVANYPIMVGIPFIVLALGFASHTLAKTFKL